MAVTTLSWWRGVVGMGSFVDWNCRLIDDVGFESKSERILPRHPPASRFGGYNLLCLGGESSLSSSGNLGWGFQADCE